MTYEEKQKGLGLPSLEVRQEGGNLFALFKMVKERKMTVRNMFVWPLEIRKLTEIF